MHFLSFVDSLDLKGLRADFRFFNRQGGSDCPRLGQLLSFLGRDLRRRVKNSVSRNGLDALWVEKDVLSGIVFEDLADGDAFQVKSAFGAKKLIGSPSRLIQAGNLLRQMLCLYLLLALLHLFLLLFDSLLDFNGDNMPHDALVW